MKKHSDNILKEPSSSGAVFLLGVAIPFLLYFFIYLFARVFPFGDKILLDADSYHQYLPFLTEFRRKLVDGSSLFYSFSGGLGYDFWATIAYYAASPLNLLLVLVPEPNVCDFMVWMTVLKVSFCGGIFSWYLYKQNSGTPFYAAAFGTMYAFSSYIVSYKYNFMWLDSIAVVPLILYGLEQLVHKKQISCYMLSLFYAIWCNFYIGYMICLFSCLYLVFLFVTEENLDRKILPGRLALFAVGSLAAGGMASVLLVPTFLALQKSTAMVSGESTGLQFLNNFASMLRAHYIESDSFRISYRDGDVHLYCGMFVLLLSPLFFSDINIRKRVRISYAAFLGFFLLSFTFQPLNFAWHGFHNQTALPNRFSFLYIILLLKMCYSVLLNLNNMEEKRLTRVVLGVFTVSIFFAVWDIVAKNTFRVSFLSFAFLSFYTVLLYEIRSSPKKEKQFSFVLCVLLILEAGSFGAVDISLNGEGWQRSSTIAWQQDYQQLLDNREDDFFRTDIDTEITNFITFVGGAGVSLFNSTMQQNICDFIRGINFPYDLNMVNNLGGTKLANDLLGVRYFVSENVSSDTWNGFEKIATFNGKTLYRNPQALSLGFMVPEEIISWHPEAAHGMEGLNSLAYIFPGDIDTLYTHQFTFTGKDDDSASFDLSEDGTIYVSLYEIPRKISWLTPEYTSTFERRLQNLFLPAAATNTNQCASLTVDTLFENFFSGSVWFCRDTDYQTVSNALLHSQLKNVSVLGNHVAGTVFSEERGILLMTIPYNPGWSITLDGAPSDFQEIGGALIGIPVTKGEHHIEMVFTPPGFIAGCSLSCIFLLFTLATVFLEKYSSKKSLRKNWISPCEMS